MVKLVDMSLNGFLNELASKSSAPGGGSVAALSGALGAALSSMVCNLTLGKENYESVQNEIRDVLKKSEQIRTQLMFLIDKDTEVFTEVVRALKMSKDTEEQKGFRSLALQKGYKSAAGVPLETAHVCEQVLDVALLVAEKGNKNSITDAAVSALMAQAGIDAAVFNVKINLGSIKDAEYVSKISSEVQTLQQSAKEKTTKILGIVEKSM